MLSYLQSEIQNRKFIIAPVRQQRTAFRKSTQRIRSAMADESRLHVALFPWAAFGHIIPYLELAKFIARKGHRVTFVSTTRNIERLPKIPPELASSIELLKVPLPKIEGLPENAEATMDIRNEDDPLLKNAYDGLEPAYTRFLEDAVPDWIIYDFAPYWLAPVGTKLGIRKASFSIINAWFLASVGPTDMMIDGTDPRCKVEDFIVPPEWVPFETKVAYKRYEINWLFRTFRDKPASGVSAIKRSGLSVRGADVFVVRHSPEFEGQWLNLLEDLHQKPVIPVGLMPPQVENNESWTSSSIKEWLDGQSPASVVYVALGSEVSLSQADVTELAHGLESSGVPFLWALRKPTASTDALDIPDGYEERVKGRGMVWKGWVPQLNILSHGSVGGFLTHCGWSSCIEGLMFGHPLVMLPFMVDQGLNARVMEDKKVGIEIPRNEEDRSFTGDSVAECVRLVVGENDGKKYKENAKELSATFSDKKLHDGYVEEFIQYMVKNKNPHKLMKSKS